MGNVKSNVNVQGNVTKDGEVVPGMDNALQELETRISDKMETNLEWYPIAKVGVTYRF